MDFATIPKKNEKYPILWSAFLRTNFPRLWVDVHDRPLVLPGEQVGAVGPTTYEGSELWKYWEKKYLNKNRPLD